MANNKIITKCGCAAAVLVCCVVCVILGVRHSQRQQTSADASTTGTAELADETLLPELMQDSDIHTITIPAGMHVARNMLVMDKDIIVEEHAQLEVGYLKIEDDISLRVKGNLNLSNAVIADTETGSRIVVQEGGTITENEMQLCISDMLEESVPVNSWEELKEAAEEKKPVRVESDITVEEDITVGTPFYIGAGIHMTAADNAVFKLCGGVLLNAGAMSARISVNDGVICNIGEMYAPQVTLSGSRLMNAGTLSLQLTEGDEAALICEPDSAVFNSGSMTAEENTGICNKGRIENSGSILVEKGCRFENHIFCNRGIFESRFGSNIGENSGIYYGYGEFRINGVTNVAVWRTADESILYGWQEVSTGEELEEAMEDDEISRIIVCEDIVIPEGTELEKPMLLDARVSVEHNGYAAIENSYVILLENGRLDIANLELCNALVVDSSGTTKTLSCSWTMDEDSAVVCNGCHL